MEKKNVLWAPTNPDFKFGENLFFSLAICKGNQPVFKSINFAKDLLK